MNSSKTKSTSTPETSTGADKTSTAATPNLESISAIKKDIVPTDATKAQSVSINTEQAPPARRN